MCLNYFNFIQNKHVLNGMRIPKERKTCMKTESNEFSLSIIFLNHIHISIKDE